jgi:hypothetical protein
VDQIIEMLPSTIRPNMRDAFVEITALGARDLQPYACQPIYLPYVRLPHTTCTRLSLRHPGHSTTVVLLFIELLSLTLGAFV